MKNIKHLFFLGILSSLIISINCDDSDDPVADTESGFIYLDDNGVTIKATEYAVTGESYELDSLSYLVVDSTMLYDMVANNEDVKKVVTTNLTNMESLFADMNFDDEEFITFNQDLSSWDVNAVTNCAFFSISASAWTESKPMFTNCGE